MGLAGVGGMVAGDSIIRWRHGGGVKRGGSGC
jgi:hypothetical protein